MIERDILSLLEQVKSGHVDMDSALRGIRNCFYADIGCAKIDTAREARTGFPEAVFGQGKTSAQLIDITRAMLARKSNVLITRADEAMYTCVRDSIEMPCEYYTEARIIFARAAEVKKINCPLLVASGGTSDIPAAEEAAVSAELFGMPVRRLYDVGVAGLHRLLSNTRALEDAGVIIAAAGMEGALPSVIAGLTRAPVIALPTSTGYGSNLHGLVPMLAMLNSCAAGLSVVNIDNGFGAACMAARIGRLVAGAHAE